MDGRDWLTLTIYLVQALLVVSMAVVVLRENRQPVKTMAWLLVLSFIPVVGIVLFIFFGKDVRKEKYISRHSLDLLTRQSMLHYVEQGAIVESEPHAELIRLFENQNVALPFGDNRVKVLADGYEFFPALLQAMKNAKEHIHLITYIFDDDALGTLIADALIDKAKEGLVVRVIYDDVGCWKVKDKFFRRMRKGGVLIEPFMPVRFPSLTSKVNYRNHRKICVIDGKVGFIGGMNIALRYVKGEGRPWRDTHLKVEGKAVYGLQTAFLTDWYFVTQTLISGDEYYPAMEKMEGGSLVQVVTSDPTSRWPELMQGYIRILLEARRYVYIETPYFLPTEPVSFALRTCALAGVDVRVLMPRKGDSRMVHWASRSFIDDMLEAGVKFYLYEKGFNHSKLLVCDDNLCSCGSANVDFRSFENNFEANAFIYDTKTVNEMKKVLFDDMAHCRRLDAETFDKRPFLEKLWESVMRLFSPLL